MHLSWIYSVSSVLYLLFYVGALFFIASKRRLNPQPAGLAMLGVGLMLLFHILGSITPLILANLFDSDSWVLYNGLLQSLITISRLAAFSLILAAVFSGRQPRDTNDVSYSAESKITANENPYVPPMSR